MKNKTLSTRPGGGAGGGVPDRSMKKIWFTVVEMGMSNGGPQSNGSEKEHAGQEDRQSAEASVNARET